MVMIIICKHSIFGKKNAISINIAYFIRFNTFTAFIKIVIWHLHVCNKL